MGFEHLHRHSDFSLLDGFAKVSEYAEYQGQINQKYLCITDHGVMGSIPQQIAEAEKHNLFPLFGVELYVNPMQPKVSNRSESAEFRKNLEDENLQKKFDKSHHLLGIAFNDLGYSNLVKLTSWAWIHGFYRRPRVNHEILMKYKEGIIFTSTCGNSEIGNAFMGKRILDEERTINPAKPKYKPVYDEDAGMEMVEKYLSMFGKHFYLELMMLDWAQQKPYDEFLIKAHAKYNIPLILTQDCFVAGTLVFTNSGFKKIEDVVVGDKVFTHKNNWKEVEVVGSRSVREGEKVYRVATEAGTYAYEATGNHEVYAAVQKNNSWDFAWVRTDKLVQGQHFLTIPKIRKEEIFSDKDLFELDLMSFLDKNEFQNQIDHHSFDEANLGGSVQFNQESQEFWTFPSWNRKNKIVIPRMLKVDEDLLKLFGRFVAEGWSANNIDHVGFALNSDEQDVADWLIAYFARFGIETSTYKVSTNGISVGFSSKVFNRLFGKMCGFDANKHLPRPDQKSWMKQWSQRQISIIIKEYWRGSRSDIYIKKDGLVFVSTSKVLIHEIACVFNSCGLVSLPCEENSKIETSPCTYSISYSSGCGDQAVRFLVSGECDSWQNQDIIEQANHYLVKVKSVIDLPDENRNVYCFRVEGDHSFTAGFYAVSNCHYCKKEHSQNQQFMLMQQNKRTLAEVEAMKENGEADDIFELQDTNLWLKSEDELNEMWEYNFQTSIDYELYKQAKANTVKIADFAKGVQIDREIKLPKIPDADLVLWDEILKGFKKRNCPKNSTYIKRIREEYELITEKGFASYFLIQKMMVDEARKKGPEILGFGDGSEAVGPGRGCLHPLTPIRLANGTVVPIEKIAEGDRVFTIDGSLKKVEKVMRYPLKNENLILIKTCYGDHFGVPLTSDHKVYAELQVSLQDKEKPNDFSQEPTGNCQWIEAGKLNVGDWCFIPKPQISKNFETGNIIGNGSKLVFDSVPDHVLGASEEIIESFLKGFISVNGVIAQDKNEFRVNFYPLAEQIRFLLLRLGIPSSIDEVSTISSDSETAYLIKCPFDKRIGNQYDCLNSRDWKKIPNGILVRICEKSKIEDIDQVFDIQVEDNHNYLTSSFLVHNSVCGSLVAYCLRLHDVEPIIHDLRFSRFLSPARGGKQQKFRHTIEPLPHKEINF